MIHQQQTTISQPFTNYSIVQSLRGKPFVVDIRSVTEAHYILSLGVDKGAAAVFIRFLNAGTHLIEFKTSDLDPIVSLSLYIPDKEAARILYDIENAIHKLTDYIAFKKFTTDSKKQFSKILYDYWIINDED